jgi:imidazolonepropionase-like amidohydrolase
MRTRIFGSLALALPLLAVAASAHAQDLALTNAHVVNVADGTITENATIVIRAGRIESVESGGAAPAGLESVDVSGMYVSPGLMDAHVHIGSVAQAKRALASGVTTVRSMGAGNYADVGLRELAKAGHVDIPEVLAAGYHVRPQVAEDFYKNHPEMGRYMEEGIRGPEAMGAMAEALLDSGVDFIKTTSTERAGLPDTDPRKQLYWEDELRALVEAGAARGVGVSSHAHGDEGARAAVEAGVTTIEHGTYMSPETLARMVEMGTYLVPTMAIVRDLTIPGGDYDNAALRLRGHHMLPRVHEMVTNAYGMGVKIVASTDTGYGPNSTVRVSHELEEFVSVGMSPLEALQSATLTAAELFGVDDHTGRVAVGLDGDLIVTERNPLENIAVFNDVLLVVNNGRVSVTRGDWFESAAPRPVS